MIKTMMENLLEKDENYFFGIHSMNMPGLNTLKILEKRQIYLIKKVQTNIEYNNDKNSHLLNEIRALEKTMNFIKWILNNPSNDIVQRTVEKYEHENKHNEEEKMDREIEKEGTLKGIFHETFSKKCKLEITLTKYDELYYILLEKIELKKDMYTWEKTAKIKMTLHKMERIIKRAYEILDGI